jgi:tight adherence protein B
VLVLLACALVFGAVLAGSFWLLTRLLPAYRDYRIAAVSETLTSLDNQFLFLTRIQAEHAVRVSVALSLLIGAVFLSGLDRLPYLLSLAGCGMAGYQLPRVGIHAVWKIRRNKIESQIPDFLNSMTGSLRAGLSLQEAIRQYVRLNEPPLSQEIGLILKKMKMGSSFEESISYLDNRLNLEEFSLISTAIVLSNSAGGSLGALFERMKGNMEERKRIRGKIRVLTAQGKLQAWIVGGLPALLGLALYFIDPELITPFWTTTEGAVGGIAILGLETAGFFMIRKIISENES